jgi:tRNA A37 threonylcarbamoyladenosine biosynthesis protein TsaE
MTIAHCKEALSKLLQDKSLRVIALSGEWGTGKTHLWNDMRKGSTDGLIQQAIKVSLFGVRSIADLKMRFIQ